MSVILNTDADVAEEICFYMLTARKNTSFPRYPRCTYMIYSVLKHRNGKPSSGAAQDGKEV